MGGKSKVSEKEKEDLKNIKIKTVKIDEEIPDSRNISVLHLDVEGYERQALKGSIETIKRCKPTIIVEKVPDKRWLMDNIYNIGYSRAGTVHHNTIFEA